MRVVEGTAQEHLDVGVQASKVVARPAREGVVNRRIDPQEYLLALTAHV
ncbi:MAG TPA: hypothetical protein VKS25_02525 [Solirubrobacteraceae bacterium]|nr:hypothetical protein [Solirubrobacteraceae bacterium]